jgi:hypothetical protein
MDLIDKHRTFLFLDELEGGGRCGSSSTCLRLEER